MYKELRGFIRIRQAYLSSPQHRIRASATTVLVSGIPRKWLTLEALSGLYDVFPGGIRNIWINRDYDELLAKVDKRDDIAHQLEDAETNLIKKCMKKHNEQEMKVAKKAGRKLSRKEKKAQQARDDQKAAVLAQGHGVSFGNQEQMTDEEEYTETSHDQPAINDNGQRNKRLKNLVKINGQAIGMVGQGINAAGRSGKKVAGNLVVDLDQGVHKVNKKIDVVNSGGGFVADNAAYGLAREGEEDEFGDNMFPTAMPQTMPKSHQNATAVQNEFAINDDEHFSKPHSTLDGAGSSTESSQHNDALKSGIFARASNRLHVHGDKSPIPFPSPQPAKVEGDEFPLNGSDPNSRLAKSKWAEAWHKTHFWKKKDNEDHEHEYPQAFHQEYSEDQDGDAVWKKYITVADRETTRLPITAWMFSLPLIGQKVDRIYHLRRELARLNAEIEIDQSESDKYPLMNSAFIQFNHQIAAHMACQSLSHHVPHNMAPRYVEIAPSDVLWGNMSIKWWERYVRVALVLVACVAILILWAVPVAFTGALSQIKSASAKYSWLGWLRVFPGWAISIIQGALPPLLLSILLAVAPLLFRLLVHLQGVSTRNELELGVQQYYFVFLFFQVFLVVSVSSSAIALLQAFINNPVSLATKLARTLPFASTYYFSYLVIQALSNSAGTILQGLTLAFWFLWAPLVDKTARQKWSRQVTLQNVTWGSYFPSFTNFAVIGIIFSIIAPLILVFNVIAFVVYWWVQRYNVIYVYIFQSDTGGLLFPQAVNQLFVGIYVMELCLFGLFLLARNAQGDVAAYPQAIIMAIAFIATIIFQVLLNASFRPLLRYLPITLEDEAVIRDEQFAKAQAAKWQSLTQPESESRSSFDIEDVLEKREQEERQADREAEIAERDDIRKRRQSSRSLSHSRSRPQNDSNRLMDTKPIVRGSWKNHASGTVQGVVTLPAVTLKRLIKSSKHRALNEDPSRPDASNVDKNGFEMKEVEQQKTEKDFESQKLAGDVLFSGYNDELEDLTVEERDTLVRYAFQHAALRARRPVVWIPRDPLGVSDDEIARSKFMSTVEVEDSEGEKKGDDKSKTFIWMSNSGTALDAKNRVIFRRSPPDFASVDLIAL